MVGDVYKIGNHNIALTNKIKYLETYTTSKLNRRQTVKEMTKTAHTASIYRKA